MNTSDDISRNTLHSPSDRPQQALHACQRGELPVAQLAAQWRQTSTTLALPARYGQVLGDVLDRLEAGALFSEESCSFSQKDLLANLQLWLDKARALQA